MLELSVFVWLFFMDISMSHFITISVTATLTASSSDLWLDGDLGTDGTSCGTKSNPCRTLG